MPKKPKSDPGDAHPWSRAFRAPGDAWPWGKPVSFAGFSDSAQGWHAWLNEMPPGPSELHVVGDILVANPGVAAQLVMRVPQGINPKVLMLDLYLVQQPGVWTDQVAIVQARFDRVISSGSPTSVDVYLAGAKIVTMQVEIAQ